MGHNHSRLSTSSTYSQMIRVKPKKGKKKNASKEKKGKKVTPGSAATPKSFQDIISIWGDHPTAHHNVMYHTFSLISGGKDVITLENLGKFIRQYTDLQDIDYHSLRELLHRATNSYEITYEQFQRIMNTDLSVLNSQLPDSTPVEETHYNKSSMNSDEYGLFSIKRRQSNMPRKRSADFGKSLLQTDGTLNRNLRRIQSLNHVHNVAEKEYKKMEQVFRAFDRDQKGTLSAKSICLVMKHVGLVQPTKRELQSLFRLIGKKSTKEEITFDDFVRLFALCHESEEKPQPKSEPAPVAACSTTQTQSPTITPYNKNPSFNVQPWSSSAGEKTTI